MTALSSPLGDARWSERAAVLAVFFQLGVFAGAWAAALPAIRSGLGLDDRALGWALLSFAGGSIAATLAAGPVVARLGARGMVRVGLLATAVSLLPPAFARSLP